MESVIKPSPKELAINAVDIRKDFPIFTQADGRPLYFLDSGASSQKTLSVLAAMDDYYSTTHANVHRGVYHIAEHATELYENARYKVGAFIGAPYPSKEIIFTKNATESINLLSHSLTRSFLKAGDVVVLTEMEHHANLVPWLIAKEQFGIEIRYIPIDSNGYLILDEIDKILEGAKVVSITLTSNVLGTINPIKKIADLAHTHGALAIGDGAQFVPHIKTDVTNLGVDFLAFTGHKMLGPTGIGILWGKSHLLNELPPFMGGGDMISDVRLDGFTPNELPWKFEAGTPPIAEAIGLAAAIDYLENIGIDNIRNHELNLMKYAFDRLESTFDTSIHIHGPRNIIDRSGVISFEFENIHPHDISQLLDQSGVCVRAGHHCAKPLMRHLGINATARASFYLYNDESDIDALVAALAKAKAFFA